jgi:hypothetical protein
MTDFAPLHSSQVALLHSTPHPNRGWWWSSWSAPLATPCSAPLPRVEQPFLPINNEDVMNKPMQRGSLQRALLSPSQLKLPPFAYAVSGPSLCPGCLYTVGNRSDAQRAEFFAVTAMAAVTGRAEVIGWEQAPGRVVIAADIDQINNLIQPKIRLVAAAWGVALPDPGRMIFTSASEPVRQLFARLDSLTGAFNVVRSKWPFALVIIDQLDVLEGPLLGLSDKGVVLVDPLHVGQCRLLTRLEGKPAVIVGQAPHRQIAHPIIVDELKASAEARNG